MKEKGFATSSDLLSNAALTPHLKFKRKGPLQQAQALVGMADQMTQLQAGYGEDRDLLNQLLGQAQMADAISQFSRTVRLSKLAYVKECKLYRQLAGRQTPNGSALHGTWEEFCNLLGHSKDKVDLDLQNLQAFGEEALESMSRMGIGYRELRQYRRLPEDQKQALIEVAKTGDKEGFVDLAEELIAKHAKEKEALAPQYEQLTQQALDAQANFDRDKDEVFAAGVDIGRLEALDFVATVANSAILPIYESIKKSKGWRYIRNPKSSNGSNFESLEEFCQVKLGKTYGRLQHLLSNRNLIGQEAFEQAEKLGLRQVDYNAIKALPAPDQELIRRAVNELNPHGRNAF
ncbi:hypothetical protein [Allofranklinella schreckenbergeri]|uniref:hypothetical protein n=1 Tax=Allofranklinella schreckenbergeri TaxID=1076744 RepID=UPI001EEF69F4|nr:hypothetical protein [Allofranklinella schreckenbergeri]